MIATKQDFQTRSVVVPNPAKARYKRIRMLLEANAFGIVQYQMSRRLQVLWSNGTVVAVDPDEILPAPQEVIARRLDAEVGATCVFSTANHPGRGRIVRIKNGDELGIESVPGATLIFRKKSHVIVTKAAAGLEIGHQLMTDQKRKA